jgi:hypothetical protein
MKTNKEKFLEIYKENIKREGSAELLQKLEKSDFFKAPASTKYHGAYEGGLLNHVLNVYYRLNQLVDLHYDEHDRPSSETIAIVALLHDISKMNYYTTQLRNVKNEDTGAWEKVPYIAIREPKDRFIFGTHSENSLFMLNSYMVLSYEEQLAILHHMGGKDFTEDSNDNGKMSAEAYKKSKLALLLHMADMTATFIDEVT